MVEYEKTQKVAINGSLEMHIFSTYGFDRLLILAEQIKIFLQKKTVQVLIFLQSRH